jgi:glycerophosphoryl diester phosphodiesterase
VKIIAHRGACREALENSWDAFYRAIDCGADRIELDVQPAADKELLIMHDESLDRTCGVHKRIDNLTRQQLEALHLSNGEPIPFLDECLTKIGDKIELNIEIKSNSEESAKKVAELVMHHQKTDNVIISSFHKSVLEALSMEYKEINLAYLYESNRDLNHRDYQDIEQFMIATGIRIFHPDAMLVTEQLMTWLKDKSWQIFPYVSNKIENPDTLWPLLFSLGIDGLCTNYPRELKAWLQIKR